MATNEILREQIFNIIENQISDNDPPETNLTLNRLIKMGYNDINVKKMIGQCVAVELFNIMKHGKPFDEKRYIKNLHQLPKEPFD